MKNRELHTVAQREAYFIELYQQLFPKVASYIAGKGGSLDDARDIFQDSVVVWYEKALRLDVEIQNEQAYIMGIAKHLWIKKFNSAKSQPLIDEHLNEVSAQEEDQLLTDKLLGYLETAGQKCMELLKAFYYDGVPVQQISELFGYSGVRSATVQKYKCLEKVRETVKQQALQYEDFIA
jgi:RNA polymerase sigma factor (sigma-70 family)